MTTASDGKRTTADEEEEESESCGVVGNDPVQSGALRQTAGNKTRGVEKMIERRKERAEGEKVQRNSERNSVVMTYAAEQQCEVLEIVVDGVENSEEGNNQRTERRKRSHDEEVVQTDRGKEVSARAKGRKRDQQKTEEQKNKTKHNGKDKVTRMNREKQSNKGGRGASNRPTCPTATTCVATAPTATHSTIATASGAATSRAATSRATAQRVEGCVTSGGNEEPDIAFEMRQRDANFLQQMSQLSRRGDRDRGRCQAFTQFQRHLDEVVARTRGTSAGNSADVIETSARSSGDVINESDDDIIFVSSTAGVPRVPLDCELVEVAEPPCQIVAEEPGLIEVGDEGLEPWRTERRKRRRAQREEIVPTDDIVEIDDGGVVLLGGSSTPQRRKKQLEVIVL